MTKEEIKNEIKYLGIKSEMNFLKSRIEQLGRELELAENERKSAEVPETLDWNNGDTYFISTVSYGVRELQYDNYYNKDEARNHTIFKTEKFAEIFREKTQFIADLLHFKWLYDRDYEPDWNDEESNWYVFYNYNICEYEVDCIYYLANIETVYFSSEEIAQKCADWLNSRNAQNKNN